MAGSRSRTRSPPREVRFWLPQGHAYSDIEAPAKPEVIMIILGVILLVIGLVAGISILWTIGIILVVIGAILWILGGIGHAVGGRRHYW